MNIALIGYGKMGKVIEDIAVSKGHQITERINSSNPIENADLSDTDVAIEFSTPGFVIKHIEHCINNHVPVIVGTTAWNDQLDYVKELVLEKNGSLLYASNFSIGVNIFFDINRRLAKLMSNHGDYEVAIEEIHHTQKLDAPSGTAVSLANDLLFENENLNSWVHEEEQAPNVKPGQVGVTSIRKKEVPGTHIIKYGSEIDEIEIKHTAFNRKGFALGAVIAAEWLANKKGIFTMQDVIKL
jgi:4-hydroxy-tetrahydrodipicolinate reductase